MNISSWFKSFFSTLREVIKAPERWGQMEGSFEMGLDFKIMLPDTSDKLFFMLFCAGCGLAFSYGQAFLLIALGLHTVFGKFIHLSHEAVLPWLSLKTQGIVEKQSSASAFEVNRFLLTWYQERTRHSSIFKVLFLPVWIMGFAASVVYRLLHSALTTALVLLQLAALAITYPWNITLEAVAKLFQIIGRGFLAIIPMQDSFVVSTFLAEVVSFYEVFAILCVMPIAALHFVVDVVAESVQMLWFAWHMVMYTLGVYPTTYIAPDVTLQSTYLAKILDDLAYTERSTEELRKSDLDKKGTHARYYTFDPYFEKRVFTAHFGAAVMAFFAIGRLQIRAFIQRVAVHWGFYWLNRFEKDNVQIAFVHFLGLRWMESFWPLAQRLPYLQQKGYQQPSIDAISWSEPFYIVEKGEETKDDASYCVSPEELREASKIHYEHLSWIKEKRFMDDFFDDVLSDSSDSSQEISPDSQRSSMQDVRAVFEMRRWAEVPKA